MFLTADGYLFSLQYKTIKCYIVLLDEMLWPCDEDEKIYGDQTEDRLEVQEGHD